LLPTDWLAGRLAGCFARVQFLPNSDVKKFFFNGFKSWWGLGGTIKVRPLPVAPGWLAGSHFITTTRRRRRWRR
jgi:hypothetical protein